MESKHLLANEKLYGYIREENTREDGVLLELREETGMMEKAVMQISPDQGKFLEILVKLMGAKRGIEVGTFTGYSSICIARGLGNDGKLVCCDLNEDWTGIAKRYWEAAGVSDRIDLRIGPASETLNALIEAEEDQKKAGEGWGYDFMFIDADKVGYEGYFEQGLKLVRSGGLLVFDNCLWNGDVVKDVSEQDEETRAIVAINKKLYEDDRVEGVLLPMADGIYVVRKR
ncbi:Putative O-methyltransferase/MSMEI_4947 [Poriferisphaera corsica]|uniref:O-methyltransferase/MSMEI_4947 n=1 Tax=Poriferisphaera corsica TaxID=2528020 RepID=A0A517YQI0_9BACT|nr:class I SAM-dependent methyltransferase [Poriferisphaera corsica]QDU32470.1 Putative O-methyltransferase/MSMEI_4947 [Poriferisphaera corsica]